MSIKNTGECINENKNFVPRAYRSAARVFPAVYSVSRISKCRDSQSTAPQVSLHSSQLFSMAVAAG
jgi:hypothetical protein